MRRRRGRRGHMGRRPPPRCSGSYGVEGSKVQEKGRQMQGYIYMIKGRPTDR